MKFKRNALLFVVLLMVVGNSQAQTLEQEYYINNLKMTVQELYDNADAYYKMSVAPVQEQLNAIPPDVSKEQLDDMIAQHESLSKEQEKLTSEFSEIRTTVRDYLSKLLSSPCDPQAVAALKGYSDPLLGDQLELLNQYESYALGMKAPLEALKSELESNGWGKLDESSVALQQFDKVWDNASYVLYVANGRGKGVPFLNDIVKRVISLRMRGFANSKTDIEQMLLNLTPYNSQATDPTQYIGQINRGITISKRLNELNQNIGKLNDQLSTISSTNEQFNELDKQRYDVVENWYDMREELDSVLLGACKYCLSQPCDTVGAYTWLRGEVEPMLEMVYHKSYKARRDSYLTLMADYDRYTIEISSFLNSMKIYTKAGQITDNTKKDIVSLLQSLDYYKNYYVKSKVPKEVSIPYLDSKIDEFEQMLANNFASGNVEIQQLNSNLRGDYLYYEDINNAANKRKEDLEWAQKGSQKIKVNGVSFTMIFVKGGTYTMGEGESAHKVTLESYFIGQTEVTQKLWKAVMGDNPSYYYHYKGGNCPVENVSWNDCQMFIERLNQLTGMNFRLPTEAEWEYAARGGNKSKGYDYSGSNTIEDVAWHIGNSLCKNIYCNYYDPHHRTSEYHSHSRQVTKKKPNELDVYDMSGNVWEWCQDGENGNNNYHLCRGGGWNSSAGSCRVVGSVLKIGNYQSEKNNEIGFRLAL